MTRQCVRKQKNCYAHSYTPVRNSRLSKTYRMISKRISLLHFSRLIEIQASTSYYTADLHPVGIPLSILCLWLKYAFHKSQKKYRVHIINIHLETFEAKGKCLFLEPNLTHEQKVWPLLCLTEF
jgi:hypothetical protein